MFNTSRNKVSSSSVKAKAVRMHDTSLFISYLKFGKLTLTNLVNFQVTAGGKLFNVVVNTENTGVSF